MEVIGIAISTDVCVCVCGGGGFLINGSTPKMLIAFLSMLE